MVMAVAAVHYGHYPFVWLSKYIDLKDVGELRELREKGFMVFEVASSMTLPCSSLVLVRTLGLGSGHPLPAGTLIKPSVDCSLLNARRETSPTIC